MKKPFLLASLAILATVVFLLAPLGAFAGNTKPLKTGTTKNDTYMVIKILDKYKVIGTSRIKDEEKRVKDEYDQKIMV